MSVVRILQQFGATLVFLPLKKKPRRFAELIMDAHPILKGIGIATVIIILVGIRLGLFRYILEKITDRMARPEE